ncbi:2-oxoglutarate dehydrogenase E1 subunit family protein, partial [Gluconobacter sp.]|uniref:2-oxoglutarate dehydrogenase E1 subunit family protein n=1 Tax=Gluconobacter sp. TaxID=1876758 RepID=UPI0039ECBF15
MGDHRDDRDAINGENTVYLAELHTRWQHDPASVDPAFASLFETLGSDRLTGPDMAGTTDSSAESLKFAYRLRGHSIASLDPLGLAPTPDIPELTPPGADRDLIARLRRAYCGTTAVEFMHLQDQAQRQWWVDRLENPAPDPSLDQKRILLALTRAEGFEQFCQKRFMGMRRFGL